MIDEAPARLRAIWQQVIDMPIGFGVWDEALGAQLKALPVEHLAILDALTDLNVLNGDVAAQVQMALTESLAHIERSRALCYLMMPSIAMPR